MVCNAEEVSFGFGVEQCLADSCAFRLIRGGMVVLILVVHVDDIFAVGKERCDQFGEDLNRMVPVKNLGELKWYSMLFLRERRRGREAEDFTADVHGRVGREV